MYSALTQYTHPLIQTDVLDKSAGDEYTPVALPLHRPFFPIRSSDGPNEIVWTGGSQATKIFGQETFDINEKYYRNEQTFLVDCIWPHQECFVRRMIPEDAKKASTAIFAHVTAGQIQQYKRDEHGRVLYDEDGNPIPLLNSSTSEPIKEPGITIRFTKRIIDVDEKIDGLETISSEVGGVRTTSYPIVGARYTSAGISGNRCGFKTWINRSTQIADIVDDAGALMWSFEAYKQPYKSNIASTVKNIYDYPTTEFTIKPGTIDTNTNRRLSVDETLERVFYNKTTSTNLLPMEIHFYADNVKLIGDLIKAAETNNPSILDGWMVDILTLKDENGNPYHHAQLDTTGDDYVVMSEQYIHYFDGGTDGDTSDEAFEALFRKFLNFEMDPDVEDYRKYQFTHIYDVGYSIATTLAMADFMGRHKRCKLIASCQDTNRHLYDMDEATSVAETIRAHCAITPESTLYKTPAMRATIFAEAGQLNNKTGNRIVPLTYWSAMRRAFCQGSPTITGSWGGEPLNVVDQFKTLNFTPYTLGQREILWTAAANYSQHRDRTTKFIPDTRSIYTLQSSLLADDEYTDVCVYLMYICDYVWTLYVSKKAPVVTVMGLIKERIERLAYEAFNTRYKVTATVYLTADDLRRKDSCHIDTELLGYHPLRRWYNTLIATDEDLYYQDETE